jgi:glycosyltransferase involved in cell wall biosynthesis
VVLLSVEGVRALSTDERGRHFVAPLPYEPRFRQRSTTADGDVVRLIDFASNDANQRVEPVLDALAGMVDKDRFTLQIFGPLPNIEALRSRTSALGLSSAVSFHGEYDDSFLTKALERADLAVHLVSPTHGEASMTQLRIWEHRLPSLVLRHGWFRELDDGAVWFVRPDREIEDIQHALSVFVSNPHRFIEMGVRGREILDRDFRPAACAQRLIEVATEVHGLIRPAMAARLADRVNDRIGPLAKDALHSLADWGCAEETSIPSHS